MLNNPKILYFIKLHFHERLPRSEFELNSLNEILGSEHYVAGSGIRDTREH